MAVVHHDDALGVRRSGEPHSQVPARAARNHSTVSAHSPPPEALAYCSNFCILQTRRTKGTFEDLASRFQFHFVGDSTTRRLAESFISIVTGEAPTHHAYHEDRDISRGSLQVGVYELVCDARRPY